MYRWYFCISVCDIDLLFLTFVIIIGKVIFIDIHSFDKYLRKAMIDKNKKIAIW